MRHTPAAATSVRMACCQLWTRSSTYGEQEGPHQQRVVHEREEREDEDRRDGLREEEEGGDDRAEAGCARLSAS